MRPPYPKFESNRAHRGFTIVELLIVVVVIAILAAITIVAYNGITSSAKESTLKSDLQNASTQIKLALTSDNAYPDNTDLLQKSAGTSFQYSRNSSAGTFCLTATNPSGLPGKSFYTTQEGAIVTGHCSGHSSDGTTLTMQAFTQSQCDSLATFTGSNGSAIVNLLDPRGANPQTYQVAKLADGNCWMLENLKLGSTTSTTILTPQDTNIAVDFTLFQAVTSGTASYDEQTVIGPVPGDTGSGATNYGYLYNWPAATAGETRTSHPSSAGRSAYDICPANWRLPTGRSDGEFAMLNAKMNNPGATTYSSASGDGYYQNWQYTGPFKGVYAGLWSAFGAQGTNGYVWSGLALATDSDRAHAIAINPTSVGIGNYSNRLRAHSIRCLLNPA